VSRDVYIIAAVYRSPVEHLDFSVPDNSLPDAVPVCEVPSAVSGGIPGLERYWSHIQASLRAEHVETELMGIMQDFDGLVDDDRKTSSLPLIGRRIAHSLKQVRYFGINLYVDTETNEL